MKFDNLKRVVAGAVTTPEDHAFETVTASLQWNRRKQSRMPAAIVRPASVADVQAAVRFASANGVRVSPRGAGHNMSGIAMQEGIVLDLSAFDHVHIDAERRIAEVGPGVTNAALAARLEAEGLAFPLGHCGSVPMSGYLLGGGLGWNSGTWGFACTRVESMDVVMPDGELRDVSPTRWPDVFWAARGAGPEFFGVVVRYRLQLEPLPAGMTTAVRVYPLSRVAELERWMADVLYTFSKNVDVAIEMRKVMHPELERLVPVAVGICVVYGIDEAEARQRHEAIAELAPPDAAEVVGPMPSLFGALYAQTSQSMPAGKRYLIDSFWADEGAGTLVSRIAEAVAAAPSEHCHSIVTRYPETRPALPDVAFSMTAPVWASVCAIWDDAGDDAEMFAWVRQTADGVGGVALGHYVGEADLERSGRLEHCYAPAALGRLRALQQLHDPQGLFRRGDGAVAATDAERAETELA